MFLEHNQTLKNVFRNNFWKATKYLKYFLFWIFFSPDKILWSKYIFRWNNPSLSWSQKSASKFEKLCVQVSISLNFLICVCLNILAITLFSLILTKFPLNVSLRVAFKFHTTLAWYFYFFEDDYKFKSSFSTTLMIKMLSK